jgi:hypothetical protein
LPLLTKGERLFARDALGLAGQAARLVSATTGTGRRALSRDAG